MDNAAMFPESLLAEMDSRYGRYLCLYFAGAISRSTGIPVGIMDAPQAGCLGHAFLILEDNADPNRIVAADATGIRTVARIRRDFLPTHGKLVWRKDQTVPERVEGFEPDAAVMAIARRLPWLAGPLGAKSPGEAEFREAEAIMDAIKRAYSPRGDSRWEPVLKLVAALDGATPEPMPTALRIP